MTTGEGESCVNIGPSERRKRWIAGGVGVAAALIGFGALRLGGAALPWRLTLFLPAWIGALGFVQARAGTCVALARRGTRNLDGREQPAPAAELDAARRRARGLHLEALFAALVATGVALLV